MSVGRASPADSSIAGQYTAWNRSTPLPSRWMRRDAPVHQRPRFSPSTGVVQRGEVVAERVPPDVDDLARVTGDRDAPAAGALGAAGDGEVREPAVDEGQDLVAALGRLDADRAVGDEAAQLAGVAGQPEEPVLLRHQVAAPCRARGSARRSAPPACRTARSRRSTGPRSACGTGRRGAAQARQSRSTPARCRGSVLVRMRSSTRQAQRLGQAGERGGVGVDELLHADPGGLRGEHVLQRVVVGPGLEPDPLAAAPAVAGRARRPARAQARSPGAGAR